MKNFDGFETKKNKNTYYKIFKYWTLIMFLLIVPLTPILITIFGFHQVDQYELEFSKDASLKIFAISSNYFVNSEHSDLFIKLLFNNGVLNGSTGIIYFDISAFNVFLNAHGITTQITIDNINDFVSEHYKFATLNTSSISVFSVDHIWSIIGPCVAVVLVTITISALWIYFAKFANKEYHEKTHHAKKQHNKKQRGGGIL